MRIIVIGIIALAAAAPALAQASPKPDAKLLAAVQACGPSSRALLEQVVNIDSGTGDAEGLNKVGAIFADKLRELGATVKTSPPTPPSLGDNVVASVTGSGKGRILLIAHMDTVFSRGAVAARPPKWVGDQLVGPGAGDDKSGVVTAICALSALKTTGYRDFARIDLIINASEETGSFGSRDLIRAMAKEADVAINLERGVPTDKSIVSRKGSATLVFEFTGRAAHSGLEPENGRNAALEAARVALDLGKLADPAKQTTVNVTVLSGGDKINVIPDRALVKADVRVQTPDEFDRIEKQAAKIAAAPAIDGVTMTSRLDRNFPPWPHAASTDALLVRANKLYAELGRQLSPISVGSSADVAFAAETGVPSLDGFGMEGDGAHGVEDKADLATLTPRAYLLARVLQDFGRNPPKK
ncbi:MAG: M20 family metallopeptidase [Hyphomonadaceae bacterium]